MTNNEVIEKLHRQVIEMNIGIYDQIVSINVTKPTGIRGVGDIGAYLHTLQYNPKGKLGEYQFRFIDSLRTASPDESELLRELNSRALKIRELEEYIQDNLPKQEGDVDELEIVRKIYKRFLLETKESDIGFADWLREERIMSEKILTKHLGEGKEVSVKPSYEDLDTRVYKCSGCNGDIYLEPREEKLCNYCPNCGKKVKGVEQEGEQK